jgi:hypothetical protein
MQSKMTPQSQLPHQAVHVLVDTSVIDLPQGKLCLGSLIFALSKTQGISRVVFSHTEKLSAQVQDLLNKIPRSILVETKEKEFLSFLKDESLKLLPSDLVLVYSLPLFVLPDSIVSGALGLSQAGLSYVQFEENTSTEPGIISFAARYWKVPSYSNSSKRHTFMTKAVHLQQDMEIFSKYDQPFEILDVLRGRKIATPMPSLATSLPLPVPNYPMINWQATVSMIEQAMF